jgi:hypothetical protein
VRSRSRASNAAKAHCRPSRTSTRRASSRSAAPGSR